MLHPRACPILAPVFDSLFCFYEAALGHPVVVGNSPVLSDDEQRLLRLVQGAGVMWHSEISSVGARLLGCVLMSTCVMLDLTFRDDAAQEA